jgi:hypothetical protein
MNEAVHFKPGKKEFLRIFPEQQQLLDSLFKEKPNLKNRVQLVTIMEMLEK